MNRRTTTMTAALATLCSPVMSLGGAWVRNEAGIREGAEIAETELAQDPKLARRDVRVEVMKAFDGRDFKATDATPKVIAGSYSIAPMQGRTNVPMLWGVAEELPPGRYAVVYRVQLGGAPRQDSEACFADVCVDGQTIAGRRPRSSEVRTAEWELVAVPIELSTKTRIELRLWAIENAVALDRVYLLSIRD